MNTDNRKIVSSEQASFTELLENQEAIILDLGTLHYYTLNGTAIFLWKLLRNDQGASAETLSANLATAFDLSLARAEADTGNFLAALHEQALISFTDTPGHSLPSDVPAKTGDTIPLYQAPQLQLSSSLLEVTLSGSSSIAGASISSGS